MKQLLKQTVYRLFRPALRDVLDRLEALQPLIQQASRLESQNASHAHQLTEVKSALADTARRVARIEQRLITGAVWRGGLSGCAVDQTGMPVPEMTAKYHAELAYWEAVVRRDSIPTWGMPFDDVFAIWQRVRLTELGEFLELGQGDAAFESLPAWARERRALEIGSGPFPALALMHWARAFAVDPLAEGYITEQLTPTKAHAAEIAFIAATGESIPLPAHTIDLVVIENCLDHVENPAAVMHECRRLLRPGGLIWLLVDLMDYRDNMHPNPFSEQSIKSLVTTTGFEVIRDRVNDHKSHPAAYGEYRVLARVMN
ncbi:MAG: hypothetical protein AMXMBFR58_05680 [Phycisphaerae bacterium]